jgi:hypothetical protein
MNQIKLVLNIKGLDPSGLELYTGSIIYSLTGNSKFPSAITYLPALVTAKNDLHILLTAAVPNTTAINSKVKQVKKLLLLIKAVAEFESKDDPVTAVSSGFTIKQPSLPKARVFDVKQSKMSGAADMIAPYAGSRATYVWEIIPDPIDKNTWVQLKITNTSSYTATGLTPGNQYWFRVKAIVNDEDQPYTDPHKLHVV